MTTKENETVFRRWLQALNEGDIMTLAEIADPNIQDHAAESEMITGFEQVKSSYLQFRSSYPDMHYTIEDLLSDDDKVICRWRLRGTNRVTGEQLVVNGINIDRIANGKIIEHWAHHNRVEP